MGAVASKVINFRAPAAKQALIDHAVEVSGMNRTEFILDAVCEKAREVLADQTRFALDTLPLTALPLTPPPGFVFEPSRRDDVTGVLRLEIIVSSTNRSDAVLGEVLVKGATNDIAQLELRQ